MFSWGNSNKNNKSHNHQHNNYGSNVKQSKGGYDNGYSGYGSNNYNNQYYNNYNDNNEYYNNTKLQKQKQLQKKKQEKIEAVILQQLSLDSIDMLFNGFDTLLNELSKKTIDTSLLQLRNISINSLLNISTSYVEDLLNSNDEECIEIIKHRVYKYYIKKKDNEILTLKPFLKQILCSLNGKNCCIIEPIALDKKQFNNKTANNVFTGFLTQNHKTEEHVANITANVDKYEKKIKNEYNKSKKKNINNDINFKKLGKKVPKMSEFYKYCLKDIEIGQTYKTEKPKIDFDNDTIDKCDIDSDNDTDVKNNDIDNSVEDKPDIDGIYMKNYNNNNNNNINVNNNNIKNNITLNKSEIILNIKQIQYDTVIDTYVNIFNILLNYYKNKDDNILINKDIYNNIHIINFFTKNLHFKFDENKKILYNTNNISNNILIGFIQFCVKIIFNAHANKICLKYNKKDANSIFFGFKSIINAQSIGNINQVKKSKFFDDIFKILFCIGFRTNNNKLIKPKSLPNNFYTFLNDKIDDLTLSSEMKSNYVIF